MSTTSSRAGSAISALLGALRTGYERFVAESGWPNDGMVRSGRSPTRLHRFSAGVNDGPMAVWSDGVRWPWLIRPGDAGLDQPKTRCGGGRRAAHGACSVLALASLAARNLPTA